VRPSSCKRGRPGEASRLEEKYIMTESMEMTLVVQEIKEKVMVEAERVYQAKTTACTRDNWKVLYYFSTSGTILESITMINWDIRVHIHSGVLLHELGPTTAMISIGRPAPAFKCVHCSRLIYS